MRIESVAHSCRADRAVDDWAKVCCRPDPDRTPTAVSMKPPVRLAVLFPCQPNADRPALLRSAPKPYGLMGLGSAAQHMVSSSNQPGFAPARRGVLAMGAAMYLDSRIVGSIHDSSADWGGRPRGGDRPPSRVASAGWRNRRGSGMAAPNSARCDHPSGGYWPTARTGSRSREVILLPGLRRATEGLLVWSAPVHASRGPLSRPLVAGQAIPDGEAARSDDRHRQDTGCGPDPESWAAHGQDGAHAGHRAGSIGTREPTGRLVPPPPHPGEIGCEPAC